MQLARRESVFHFSLHHAWFIDRERRLAR